MLSDPERRTLHDIERRLVREDPSWAEVFGGPQRELECSYRPTWARLALALALGLAAALATIAVVLDAHSLTAFLPAAIALFIWVLDRPRPRSGQPHDEHRNPRS
ncbi:DUF3040 domain-containing protein [Actinomycetospora cinnamomea]|uniref:DUF3040 family protein n=1 Tax=Actinomycetospora cinnamomea TaxID=663609 RepID=A0A2U1EZJ1_9PSEU|nr:DUF3040 domain-containing protein [Actinomycetospora cinnamomea]PVZ05336.1 hypothetical protein C8D89_11541 [Actinomycetospora cinnamomea]